MTEEVAVLEGYDCGGVKKVEVRLVVVVWGGDGNWCWVGGGGWCWVGVVTSQP